MKRKLLNGLLITVLSLSLFGCGNTASENINNDTEVVTQEESVPEEEAETTIIEEEVKNESEITEEDIITVELTVENFNEYIGMESFEAVDEFGDSIGSNLFLTSKMYEKGYVVCKQEDVHIEWYAHGDDSAMNHMIRCVFPRDFGVLTPEDITINRVKGTISYIPLEKVSDYSCVDGERTLNGETETSNSILAENPW